MKPLSEDEEKIIGKWVLSDDGNVVEDENCKRIKWLIENQMEKITLSKENGEWEILYKDANNRFWEKTYLQSELHGGGPPSLFLISEDKAHEKYNF